MEDEQVLQHLLNLEAEAAALVNDAQAEADRRTAESEKIARAKYDEEYGREVAVLEEQFAREIAAVREDYKKQLDAYGESVKTAKVDAASFNSLAAGLLLQDAAFQKKAAFQGKA